MLGFFPLRWIVPIYGLDTVPFGVVSVYHLHNVAFAKVVALHERIDDAATLPSHASAYPVCPFFFSHNRNVHQSAPYLQDMFNLAGFRLLFVQHLGYNQATITGFGIEFVTGLFATVGLLRNGQRPAPGESQSPLSGCCFLECF